MTKKKKKKKKKKIRKGKKRKEKKKKLPDLFSGILQGFFFSTRSARQISFFALLF